MIENTPEVIALLDRALSEDVGLGDWTTIATVPEEARGAGRIVAKSDCVVAGLGIAGAVWPRLGGEVEWKPLVADGDRVKAGQTVAEATGCYRTLLTGERLALNLLQRMSGIATAARAFVDAVEGTGTRVVDTRKTVPGLRALDKYAVRVGGAANHRAALDGGVLIKENHIAAAGSIVEAVRRARACAPITLKVEIETRDLDEFRQALDAGADIIMLDNMPPDMVRQAVAECDGRALLEASGNVNLGTVRALAEAGADIISVGALTHSVVAADLSMLIVPVEG